MDKIRDIIESHVKEYTIAYVDCDAEELFEMTQMKLSTPIKFINFRSKMNHYFTPNIIFLIYSNILKLNKICQLCTVIKLKKVKIITFPREISGANHMINSYGLSQVISHEAISIGYYPYKNKIYGDRILKIGSDYKDNIQEASKLFMGNKKYFIERIGDDNLRLGKYHSDESLDLFLILNRKSDWLSVVLSDLTFMGYLYESGYDFKELSGNSIYNEIKNMYIISSNNRIREIGQELLKAKESFEGKENDNEIIRKKMDYAKRKEEFHDILQISLDINEKYVSNSETLYISKCDQLYMHAFHKLIENKKSIINDIEILINREYNPIKVIRLMCAQIILLGMSKNHQISIKKEIIEMYGYFYLYVMKDIIEMGMTTYKKKAMSHKFNVLINKYLANEKWKSVTILFNGGIVYSEMEYILELDKVQILTNKIIYPDTFIENIRKYVFHKLNSDID